mmetsp:Transcript_10227/g.13957  ORF Transcript_10227/g.13957 Transcript_10227/m.13957 type:complete len:406 (+) Transcript_10227:168-1385(+)
MADNNVRIYVQDRFGYNRVASKGSVTKSLLTHSPTVVRSKTLTSNNSKTSTSNGPSQVDAFQGIASREAPCRVRRTPRVERTSTSAADLIPTLNNTTPSKTPSRRCKNLEVALKRLVSGAFAGVVSRTVVAPLDVAKLKFMLQPCGGHIKQTIVSVLKDTVRKEGVKGLFRGNGLNCCRIGPSKAIELCVFETLNSLLGRADIAGGAAGAVSTLATYPLEVLRTRVALNPEYAKGGVLSALRRISRVEGKQVLYRGCAFSVAGVIPYTAAQYVVYDALCKTYLSSTKANEVPAGLHMLFGSVAAVAASAVTFPMEVYRRQLQLSGGTNAVAMQSLKSMVQQGGPTGIYRGLGASCLKLAPAAGVSFLCYEAAKCVLQIGIPPLAVPDQRELNNGIAEERLEPLLA